MTISEVQGYGRRAVIRDVRARKSVESAQTQGEGGWPMRSRRRIEAIIKTLARKTLRRENCRRPARRCDSIRTGDVAKRRSRSSVTVFSPLCL